MPIETASLTFYAINQCGFYTWGGDEPQFGNTHELLAELQEWSEGKELQQTKLYEPTGDLLPVYLLDIRPYENAWLVTVWNQVPAAGKNIASVMGQSRVGNADVVMNKIVEGSIPGFATYFWFIPEHNIFASARFSHLITAQKAMQVYMESFLEFASSHAIVERMDGQELGLNVIGYRADPAAPDEALPKVSPRFRTRLIKHPGKHEYILRNFDRISRVERSMLLRLNKASDLEMWQKLIRFTNMHKPAQQPEKMRLKYRLTTEVTEQDVRAMIDSWNEGAEKQWDDYGFVFRGSSDIHWLSHSLARKEFDLEVNRMNDEVVEPESLLKALHAIKPELLRMAQE